MQKIHFSASASQSCENFDSLAISVSADGQVLCDNLTEKAAVQSLIQSLQENGDFKGKTGEVFTLAMPSGLSVKRLYLVGLGECEKLTSKSYLAAITALSKAVNSGGTEKLLNATIASAPQGRDSEWCARQNVQIFQRSFYSYEHVSRGKFESPNNKLAEMHFTQDVSEATIAIAQATAMGMEMTQDLANMPPNFCTPTHLAETAQELGETYGFDVNILDKEQMLEMGMGSFMSVAQGSATPPKMICMQYNGGGDEAPIALVGKGVTFDTGGISLKPGEAMDEMKYDMGGAATVFGVFKALGELKPNINVVAVVPSTENMPGGKAVKPGDVVTSLSGQTIEILNTDAEGRLILCDALTYCQQTYKPAKVIDMATLTGACIIALGKHVSGILGNDQALIDEIRAAGEETYDRLWQLPLGEEWDEQLKSNFADMANIGGRAGGTITAAQFLARFTKEIPWAHLDIAGTAWVSGNDKGATGRPVPALVEYLNKQAK
ncbi:leucyl aminopeptidase [Thiomicrorhabdus sp. 6S2-11]|uniref:Probable cytosol aminopeptidase n=1 Tax=Thiomicrorhabdus marina TaxID=2818442 RepID=A0ABS3Q240_9GAMM|nr:leucyl aminopeptidase [Thiomicrorhabdus marina]MBO1926385.1 leucyl aminopeptidase [Thiomicrorhabdus marina]